MEFYQELFLTALISILISILLAFLVGKLAAVGSDADDLDAAEAADIAGGSSPIGEKRIRFRDPESGTDPIDEAIEDDRMEDEKSSEIPPETSEEARADVPGLVEESRDLELSESIDVRSERSTVVETSETMKIKGVCADSAAAAEGGSAADGGEVEETVIEKMGGEGEDEIRGGEESGIGERVGSLLYGEDEWEGIEKSELEKVFAMATDYVSSASAAEAMAGLSSEVQMELYGLHKVATEGPCYEPHLLSLKVSARAKWHAWQKLGNMNPDAAMEHYISLLSHSIPGWMGEKPGGDAKQDEDNDPPAPGVVGTGSPDPGSSLYSQLSSKSGSETEDQAEGDNSSVGLEHSRQGLATTLFLGLLSPTTVRFLSFYW